MILRCVLAVGVLWLASLASPLSSSGQSCADCHADLTADKTAHAAVAMGCESCHTAIDPSDVPHKIKNNIKRGLSAEQPDLCFSCHDKAQFSKQNVHAAVSMGCTSCHNPH
ncbi:MAG TPA: cytochrome c3 family protein, partial [Nitrospirota bacterium]|nr:cytochrome c3 family protein [Nitrospirota bacterium]